MVTAFGESIQQTKPKSAGAARGRGTGQTKGSLTALMAVRLLRMTQASPHGAAVRQVQGSPTAPRTARCAHHCGLTTPCLCTEQDSNLPIFSMLLTRVFVTCRSLCTLPLSLAPSHSPSHHTPTYLSLLHSYKRAQPLPPMWNSRPGVEGQTQARVRTGE